MSLVYLVTLILLKGFWPIVNKYNVHQILLSWLWLEYYLTMLGAEVNLLMHS